MAGHDLIDAYLVQLAGGMHWRDDRDDIVAELGDHLYSDVDHRLTAGADLRSAQQQTLERFGDPDLVARSFATTSKGGVAVPTQFTKSAGTLATLSAGLWVVALISWGAASRIEDSTGDWGGGSQALWLVGTVALLSAAALTVVVMMALRERHGGLGTLGTTGLVLVGLGALAGLAAWLILVWGLLITVGTLLFAFAMWRTDLAPRAATAAFGSAWSIGLLAWIGLRVAEVGTADEWGDYWAANWAFLLIGTTIFAAGLIGLGRWLKAEQPAELHRDQPLATA